MRMKLFFLIEKSKNGKKSFSIVSCDLIYEQALDKFLKTFLC